MTNTVNNQNDTEIYGASRTHYTPGDRVRVLFRGPGGTTSGPGTVISAVAHDNGGAEVWVLIDNTDGREEHYYVTSKTSDYCDHVMPLTDDNTIVAPDLPLGVVLGWEIDDEQRHTIAAQIGTGNVPSISGGRVEPIRDGIELPVSNGYRVRVRLTPADVYTVQRVLVRGGREFTKGERTDVYCEQVGEVAYRAGMFRSYDANEW